MKKNLLHYGLQRSGTNFMENLLLKNFKINVHNSNLDRSHPKQKHFRLYKEKHLIPEPQYHNDLTFNNLDEYLNALDLNVDIDGIIVVSKDPYSWLKSYREWGEKCAWPTMKHHYAQEYNLFYKKWLEFAENDGRILFIRYLDLLYDPKKELEKAQKKFKLSKNLSSKLKGIQGSLKKVSQSKVFTTNRMDYYLNKDYLKDYSKEEIDAINKHIDNQVFKMLGYEKSNK